MSLRSSSENKKEKSSGSPQSGEPLYIAIGKIRRTHGVHGELLIDLLTEFPQRFKKGSVVMVGKEYDRYTISTFRLTATGALISFEDLTDCDQAAFLRNQMIYGTTAESPRLAEGEFYHHEVLGMDVVTESGQRIGKVDEIIETGANDVYVVINEEGQEILLPVIKSVILMFIREKNEIVVRPPEWE
jgi:16S rRNA processing protein RimM